MFGLLGNPLHPSFHFRRYSQFTFVKIRRELGRAETLIGIARAVVGAPCSTVPNRMPFNSRFAARRGLSPNESGDSLGAAALFVWRGVAAQRFAAWFGRRSWVWTHRRSRSRLLAFGCRGWCRRRRRCCGRRRQLPLQPKDRSLRSRQRCSRIIEAARTSQFSVVPCVPALR